MARTVRPDILAAWASYLIHNGCATDIADALALGLEQVALGHGVSIDRLRPANDPAADWQASPDRGDFDAGIAAARAALEANRSDTKDPE
jgi:hypothetical protein